MKQFKIFVLSLISLFLIACGNSSSTSTPLPTLPAEYTYDLRTYLDKSSFTVNMKGNIDGIFHPQVTYYSKHQGNVDYQGITLDLHENTLEEVIATSYTGTYLGNVYTLESSERDCYIVSGVTPTPIPTDAPVAYESDIVPLECTDGASMEVSYILAPDLKVGNARLTVTSKLYIQDTVLVSKTHSLLDHNMSLLAYQIVIGDNISLQATSIITQY